MSPMNRVLAPLYRKLRLMVGRVVINLTSYSEGELRAQVSGLADEVRDGLPVFQQFAFASRPMPGTDAAAVAAMGARNGLIVVATNDPKTLPSFLQPGESIMYNAFGQYLYLDKDGVLHINVKGIQIVAEQGVTANCDISDRNGSMQEMRDTYNGHDHTETNSVTNHPNQLMT